MYLELFSGDCNNIFLWVGCEFGPDPLITGSDAIVSASVVYAHAIAVNIMYMRGPGL